MKLLFDNLSNILIQGDKKVPIIRKFGHPFMLLDHAELALVDSYINQSQIFECHLTEDQLRQLHRSFGHHSTQRFFRVLPRSGHDLDNNIIKNLTKYCKSCQVNSKSPGRFQFTLRDD